MSQPIDRERAPLDPFAEITIPIKNPQDIKEIFSDEEISSDFEQLVSVLWEIDDVLGVGMIKVSEKGKSDEAEGDKMAKMEMRIVFRDEESMNRLGIVDSPTMIASHRFLDNYQGIHVTYSAGGESWQAFIERSPMFNDFDFEPEFYLKFERGIVPVQA